MGMKPLPRCRAPLSGIQRGAVDDESGGGLPWGVDETGARSFASLGMTDESLLIAEVNAQNADFEIGRSLTKSRLEGRNDES